jgi:hypothetical protein
VRDDCMVVPLGMFTCNSTCAEHLFMHSAVADIKMLVQPESSIDVSFIDIEDVGGVQSKVKAK